MFKRIKLNFLCLIAAILGMIAPAHAQYTSDIDIYGGTPSVGMAPNILFVVDNTANWSSAFANEMAALVATINSLPANKFRVGLMMFTETGGDNSGNGGAYVRSAVRLMDSGYKTKLIDLLNSMTSNDDKTSGGKAGLAMAEAFYYMNGQAPYSGNNKQKTDYVGNSTGTTQSNAIYALGGNALPSKAGSPYVSPIINGCQNNYIIYISNGAVQDNNSDTTTASGLLNAAYTAAGMVRPPDITLNPSGSQSGVSDEWARFMRASSRNISTFTLDIDKVTNGQGPGWSAMLKSMAANSGGEYFDVSSGGTGSQIVDALTNIFNQIQAVDSVFSSASLPVSVNARGTYLNQIFMGVFRPDAGGSPRWLGNVKQYKFSYDAATDVLFLSDKFNNQAVSGATGFISPAATSYWSTTSTFWVNKQSGTPASSSDAPDGAIVEKGGVAQRLRETYAASQTARKVYTCIGCAANTNLATNATAQFVVSNTALTSTSLAVSAAERENLINWTRGTDNLLNESGPGGTVTVRPSIHGDVLHSRPAVVNYGTTTGVIVFYGANDGTLRAVSGKQSGTGAGEELWSFIPEEYFLKLNRLRSNSPDIRLSNTQFLATSANPPTPRNYFVDGPISVYQKILTDGTNEKVYIYASMRRGGSLLYALDVTDPAAPKFLWKKSNSDIAILGQTWSEPKVAKIRGNTNPVIIMGAGYDAEAEDVSPPGATTRGKAVLVLDAITGSLLRTFPTSRSVAADVALIDSDFDGFVDRVYATDVGGNVYRIDLEKTTGLLTTFLSPLTDWGIYTIASLGTDATRKFFYPPDVVLAPGFAALMVGSGDREKPLAATSADAFFTVYDTRLVKGTPLIAPSIITRSTLGQVGTTANKDAGCFINMSTSGEKIVNAPVSVGGITYFGTNQPNSASTQACTANLGLSKVYSAPLFCKDATSQNLIGGGLPPSPVSGTVLVSYTLPNSTTVATKYVPFIIGAPNSKGSAIEGSKVNPTINPVRSRRYWYLENAR